MLTNRGLLGASLSDVSMFTVNSVTLILGRLENICLVVSKMRLKEMPIRWDSTVVKTYEIFLRILLRPLDLT